MLKPVLLRLAALSAGVAVTLAAGALVVVPAAADDTTTPPGLGSLPDSSAANLVAVPLGQPFGRKLR